MALQLAHLLPSRLWLRRYTFYFIIGLLFLSLQLYLAYKSYNIPNFKSNDYISSSVNRNKLSNSVIRDNSNHQQHHKHHHNNHNQPQNNAQNSNSLDGDQQNSNHLSVDLIDDEDQNGNSYGLHSNSNAYSKTSHRQQKEKPNSAHLDNSQTVVAAAASAAINPSAINHGGGGGVKSKPHLRLDELSFKPACDIVTREAISAIYRSETQECKKLIANITCDIQNDVFYPKVLPNYCPTAKYVKNRLLGCFKDSKSYRILSGYYTNFKSTNSPEKCIQMCLQSGFLYAGVQYSTECFCGNSEPLTSAKLADPSCNMKCSGNPKQACGGYFTINVYETGISKFTPQIAELTTKSHDTPVKVAFLLTLNGRAIRQVYRLLKSLYTPDHFYYIHIDSRQDYLYRELLVLETKYPNIRLSRKRFATIWGGASLLTMLLTSMTELLASEWDWDFVINLSESDFPVKTVDKLVEFLTANKNKNFVKSHGREVQRFIQKQGLDKTFVECDTHMWRTGDRELPAGIQIDGGSDWITLSRDFVTYLSDEDGRDELIDGLLKIFRHTLLPAESFFHTAIRNSRFCHTYIDNNLHVTNWKRRLGCKCQYKHVVDWCGCSPNDFKPEDWGRLQSTETKQLFFARKFEPVINQAIILQLEEWLYGPYPNDFLNLNNYWQSIYNAADKTPRPDDALSTVATSLVRINSLNLDYIPKTILEITSFYENDQYKGFLITHDGWLNDTDQFVFESWAKPTQVAKSSSSASLGKRLRLLEVASDYDQKEQIARNVGKFLGPNSEPVLVFRLAGTAANAADNHTNFNVSLLWIDPIGNIAAIDDYHIEDGHQSSTNFVKAGLKTPMIPGVWTVKMIQRHSVIAQCRFLVTPLQFYRGIGITSKQAEKINAGTRTDVRSPYNLNYAKLLLPESERVKLEIKSVSDATRVGLDLQIWIDSLTKQFYEIKSTCVHPRVVDINISETIVVGANVRQKFAVCRDTNWSTFAPDPKSDISDLSKK